MALFNYVNDFAEVKCGFSKQNHKFSKQFCEITKKTAKAVLKNLTSVLKNAIACLEKGGFYYVVTKYLKPLVTAEKLALTISEKPKSKFQKYFVVRE